MKKIMMAISFLLFLCGCGEQPPESKSDAYIKPVFSSGTAVQEEKQSAAAQKQTGTSSKQTAASKSQPAQQQPAASKTKPAEAPKGSDTISGSVESVINYGTGVTPLSIKKRQEEKLKDIQNQHNSELENAIREN